MSSTRIKIEVEGEAQFNRVFSRFDAELKNLTPVWDDLRDKFWEIEKKQFNSQGAAGRSGAWKSLNRRYAIKKAQRYGVKPILRATNAMYKSLTGQTSDTIYQKSDKEMAIGTSLERARYHQSGAGRLPKREIISLSESQKRELMKTIQKSLVRELRRGGIYA